MGRKIRTRDGGHTLRVSERNAGMRVQGIESVCPSRSPFARFFAAYRNAESVVDREDSNPDASSDGGTSTR